MTAWGWTLLHAADFLGDNSEVCELIIEKIYNKNPKLTGHHFMFLLQKVIFKWSSLS